jgi:hypothetical protein
MGDSRAGSSQSRQPANRRKAAFARRASLVRESGSRSTAAAMHLPSCTPARAGTPPAAGRVAELGVVRRQRVRCGAVAVIGRRARARPFSRHRPSVGAASSPRPAPAPVDPHEVEGRWWTTLDHRRVGTTPGAPDLACCSTRRPLNPCAPHTGPTQSGRAWRLPADTLGRCAPQRVRPVSHDSRCTRGLGEGSGPRDGRDRSRGGRAGDGEPR